MSNFSIRYPYFIIVCSLIACVMGLVSLSRMEVDLFPEIKIPVVAVATFYAGMPPEQIETSITGPFERFFTLASNVDHIESRSLPGVSIIKIYFKPGSNPDSAVSSISNLAMAQLRRLPPGTLPPVVLKFDASSLPVCLITLKDDSLDESKLRDLGQFNVRNQVATVPGASVPQPFGGKYRQIMVYVDPLKLQAYQLSLMDIVRKVNEANVILPAGDTLIGPIDYNLFSNSQTTTIETINAIPLKNIDTTFITVSDVGQAVDGSQIQTNIVRIDGQRSVYLPVLKQGGDSNTISIVDGIRNVIRNLTDVPKELITKLVFDQSIFVKQAISNLIHEGTIGLILTALMILIFLGSVQATFGVFLSIPLSILLTFTVLDMGGNSINSMILGGLALVFSRIIDNSIVVLENIYSHLEKGEDSITAAQKGAQEVALPVLAATLATAIVFFPVTLLYGVSQYLFTALALAVVIALAVSYLIAMTVVPLYCSKFLKSPHNHKASSKTSELPLKSISKIAALKRTLKIQGDQFNLSFNTQFEKLLHNYRLYVEKALQNKKKSLLILCSILTLSLGFIPFIGVSYFPKTDAGQFLINLKTLPGTRVEITELEVKKLEDIIRKIIHPQDLDVIVSNIGSTPDFSALYTSNTAPNTAFIQVSLTRDHQISSFDYMERVRKELQKELPHLTTYFQTGGLVDSVVNLGLPAPINIQVSGFDSEKTSQIASQIAVKVKALDNVGDVFIPQDVRAPSLMIDVNRQHAIQLGLNMTEVISNVITALTSNQMIAPSYWIDPKNGNDYLLTVQYPEGTVKTLEDLKSIPLRGVHGKSTLHLDAVCNIKEMTSPTVISHYQLQRVIDIFISPKHENLSRLSKEIDDIIHQIDLPADVRIYIRGSVESMHQSFKSFAVGILLSTILVYLVLVAQFKSFIDPLIILLAIPPGIAGTLLILALTGTTLNIMSLMGIIMMIGIAVSNSILIVEFANHLQKEAMTPTQAVISSCRLRLRPILMTSLATVIGLIPMALALEPGSEAYASLARVIIGGLSLSVVMTIFLVPIVYALVYDKGPLIPFKKSEIN